jgi:undecaprenyl diphosphate synthase
MYSVNHLAIIMDGNDRWASGRSLKTADGHRAGAQNAVKLAKASANLGVKHLSLFAFSSENLNRPQDEVKNFISLLSEYAVSEIKTLIDYRVKIKFVGDISWFGKDVEKKLIEAEKRTEKFDALNLYILLNYGSRSEIVNACSKIVASGVDSNSVNEEFFKKNLYCPEMPDVDLLIRTGDKIRISNFLLWQSAYAELYFSKKLWPDFSTEDLQEAIIDYSKRERTFGIRNAG